MEYRKTEADTQLHGCNLDKNVMTRRKRIIKQMVVKFRVTVFESVDECIECRRITAADLICEP